MKIADVLKAKWGDIHYLVLAATLRAPESTVAGHWERICKVTGRNLAIGQVYAAIERLEAFECVTSRVDAQTSTAARGTRTVHPARIVTLTASGRELLARNPLVQILDLTAGRESG